jgi:uncharacterized protein YcbK (DUF882 family)
LNVFDELDSPVMNVVESGEEQRVLAKKHMNVVESGEEQRVLAKKHLEAKQTQGVEFISTDCLRNEFVTAVTRLLHALCCLRAMREALPVHVPSPTNNPYARRF